MSNIEFLILLKKQVLLMIDRTNLILNKKYSNEISLVRSFFNNMPIDMMVKHIDDRVLPWKKFIVDKDINFFYKNHDIFRGLDDRDIDFFSEMATSDKVTQEDRDEIFEFFIVILELVEAIKKHG